MTEHRDPWGVVLVLGTWNYPLFLTGVQAVQALVAGNAVLLKPGRGSTAATATLRDGLVAAGFDPRLVGLLPESTAAAQAALDHGVDKVVLTGAADTGRAVLNRLSDTLTPAAMELSGCDAVFVRGDADLDLVTQALTLGMTINSSATCIAPRRVFVHRGVAAELEARLATAFAGIEPAPVDPRTADDLENLVADALRRGAKLLSGRIDRNDAGPVVKPILLGDASPAAELLQADLFAPVLSLIPVANDGEGPAAQRPLPLRPGGDGLRPVGSRERSRRPHRRRLRGRERLPDSHRRPPRRLRRPSPQRLRRHPRRGRPAGDDPAQNRHRTAQQLATLFIPQHPRRFGIL